MNEHRDPSEVTSVDADPRDYAPEHRPLDAQTILEHTLEHGGGTFRPDGSSPTEGVAVGIHVGTFATLTAPMADEGPIVSLGAFRAVLKGLQAQYPGAMVGTWLYDGMVYVDPIVVVPNRAQALAIGRATKQRAVYDITSGETVDVVAESVVGA